jgi:hypothetical protein
VGGVRRVVLADELREGLGCGGLVAAVAVEEEDAREAGAEDAAGYALDGLGVE